MKHIFFQLCIICLALGARAQEAARMQLPPVKTGGPAVVRQAAAPILPLKSGGNAVRQQKSVQSAVVPVKSSGNAQQTKLQQPAEVPIHKTDAPAAASTGDGAKNKVMSKDKPAVTLPSSLSVKEAKEQSRQ
jgi:hypothetical protein